VKRRSGESGQVLMVFALALSLVVCGLLALNANASALFAADARVNAAALEAAQAGASEVDYSAFYDGGLPRLNRGQAVAACQAVLRDQRMDGGSCIVRGETVTATAQIRLHLPFNVPGTTFPVSATVNVGSVAE